MNSTVTLITSIVGAVIGVAILAVLMSPNAQTSSVIGSAGAALSGIVATAVSPVTGTGAGSGVYSGTGSAGFGGFAGGTGSSGLSSLLTPQNMEMGMMAASMFA